MKRRRRLHITQDDAQLFLLSLPTAVWYLCFCYLPMFGVIIAFKNYRVAAGKGFIYSLLVNSKWVGFENFMYLFKTKYAAIIFKNTIGYNAIFIVLGVVIPVALAIMISELYSAKLRRVCQTAMFLPHFLSWVVVGYFVFAFLSTDKGLANGLIKASGGAPIFWYQSPQYWPYLLVFMQLWKTVGYGMVVYLAAINGIDGALYEAAVIDGANKSQQVRYITLPLLRPIMSIMVIMAVGRIFNSDFGLFYRTTQNSNSLTSVFLTIDVYVYNSLFAAGGKPQYTYASAAGLLQSVLGCLTLLTANAVVKKIDPDSAFF
ncbi:sugar ABC transporter permease [Clostridia bacterium]|nr:sugar ABC transporter permease [Clostridia bacterium]